MQGLAVFAAEEDKADAAGEGVSGYAGEGSDISVVGEDIEIGEDEVKIVSFDENSTPVESPIVGEGIEIGDDEAKIVSIGEEIEDSSANEEVMPISTKTGTNAENASQSKNDASNLVYYVAGGILIAGIALWVFKKRYAHSH